MILIMSLRVPFIYILNNVSLTCPLHSYIGSNTTEYSRYTYAHKAQPSLICSLLFVHLILSVNVGTLKNNQFSLIQPIYSK